MIQRFSSLGLFALLAVSAFGCASTEAIVGGRGTIPYQQARASLYDPFPDPYAGPELVGVRPREYDTPRAEERRDRLFRETYWGMGNWMGFGQ